MNTMMRMRQCQKGNDRWDMVTLHAIRFQQDLNFFLFHLPVPPPKRMNSSKKKGKVHFASNSRTPPTTLRKLKPFCQKPGCGVVDTLPWNLAFCAKQNFGQILEGKLVGRRARVRDDCQ
jgi:hypothetical protein